MRNRRGAKGKEIALRAARGVNWLAARFFRFALDFSTVGTN